MIPAIRKSKIIPVSLKIETDDRGLVVRPNGRLDLNSLLLWDERYDVPGGKAGQGLAEILKKYPRPRFDLQDVSRISPCGGGLLLRADRISKAAGQGGIILVNPPPPVLGSLKRLGLASVITIELPAKRKVV